MNCVSGRILIATGDSEVGHGAQHTEVIDLTSSKFEYDLLKFIPERWGSVGGLLQDKPLICGGYSSNTNEYFKECIGT